MLDVDSKLHSFMPPLLTFFDTYWGTKASNGVPAIRARPRGRGLPTCANTTHHLGCCCRIFCFLENGLWQKTLVITFALSDKL